MAVDQRRARPIPHRHLPLVQPPPELIEFRLLLAQKTLGLVISVKTQPSENSLQARVHLYALVIVSGASHAQSLHLTFDSGQPSHSATALLLRIACPPHGG